MQTGLEVLMIIFVIFVIISAIIITCIVLLYIICCIYYLLKGIIKQIAESIYWLYHDLKVKYYKRKFKKKNKRGKEIFKDLAHNKISVEIEIDNSKLEQHRKEIITNIQLYLQREGYITNKPINIQDMGEKTKTLYCKSILKEYNKNVKEI